jgi:hypothetical protein
MPMTITIEDLTEALHESAEDPTILVRYGDTCFYVSSVKISESGDIIFVADEENEIEEKNGTNN